MTNYFDSHSRRFRYGGNIYQESSNGRYLLHYAAEAGGISLVRLLLSKDAETCFIDKDGYSPLHLALLEGFYEVARMLIEYEVGSRQRIYDKMIYEEAYLQSDNKASISQSQTQVCSSHLGDAEIQGQLSHRPSTRFESVFGSSSLVLLLDQTTKEKDSALHLASRAGQLDIVKLLIKHGAIYKPYNKRGENPASIATRKVGEYLGQIDHFFDAVRNGHEHQVREILSRDSSCVNARESSNLHTPLNWAVHRKHNHVARALLEHGADVTLVCIEFDDTILHIASTEGNNELLEDLLNSYPFQDKSMFVNAHNCDHISPLQEAANIDIARSLMRSYIQLA